MDSAGLETVAQAVSEGNHRAKIGDQFSMFSPRILNRTTFLEADSRNVIQLKILGLNIEN